MTETAEPKEGYINTPEEQIAKLASNLAKGNVRKQFSSHNKKEQENQTALTAINSIIHAPFLEAHINAKDDYSVTEKMQRSEQVVEISRGLNQASHETQQGLSLFDRLMQRRQ